MIIMIKLISWNGLQRPGKETGGTGEQKNWDHSDHNTIEIGWNTENSPEDLMRCDVTQTSVKNHQLELVWKSCIEWN